VRIITSLLGFSQLIMRRSVQSPLPISKRTSTLLMSQFQVQQTPILITILGAEPVAAT